ncbi:MAG: DUF3108 domain-containing protein [Lysobacterales bacterium]
MKMAWVAGLGILLAQTLAAEPQAFEATFTVSRNDKALGQMQMKLSPAGSGWQFVSRTEGNKGLAGFLGVTIEERSTLRLLGDRLSTERYRYQQDMIGRHRSRSLEVGADGKIAETDNDDHWQYHSQAPLVDKHAVVLAIAERLTAGADAGTVFDIPVASKGKVESWRFLIAGRESISTGTGQIDTVRVERLRENSDRKTVSWHAAAYGYLPVKVEQVEPDGERLVSLLEHFGAGG